MLLAFGGFLLALFFLSSFLLPAGVSVVVPRGHVRRRSCGAGEERERRGLVPTSFSLGPCACGPPSRVRVSKSSGGLGAPVGFPQPWLLRGVHINKHLTQTIA